jgi:hypothetical protein
MVRGRIVAALGGVLGDRGRFAGAGVDPSTRRTSAWLTRMWSINSPRPRNTRLKRRSSGINGARFHSREPSALVRPIEARGADLRAWRPDQDLRRGRRRLVVQVAQHDQGPLATLAVEQLVGEGA